MILERSAMVALGHPFGAANTARNLRLDLVMRQ